MVPHSISVPVGPGALGSGPGLQGAEGLSNWLWGWGGSEGCRWGRTDMKAACSCHHQRVGLMGAEVSGRSPRHSSTGGGKVHLTSVLLAIGGLGQANFGLIRQEASVAESLHEFWGCRNLQSIVGDDTVRMPL